jgi:hypothetical protein
MMLVTVFVTALHHALRTAFRTHDEHRPEPEPEPEPDCSSSYVCLWLLVVETLIFNIISQRARPMMTRNQR